MKAMAMVDTLGTSFLPSPCPTSLSLAWDALSCLLPAPRLVQHKHRTLCIATSPSVSRKLYKGPRREPPRVRDAILKPPLDDRRIAERFLSSPQLSLKSLPLLSSCLPPAPLRSDDFRWMERYLPEVKEALGYPLEGMESPSEDNPLFHLDTLLYLSFQHPESDRSKTAKYVRVGHSRLCFLGQFIVELALVEYFLQRYPREMPACMRERVFGLLSKKVLPHWIESASIDGLIFPDQEMRSVKMDLRLQTVRAVFWALVGALYLAKGMGEVYRLLFEVFGLDPDAKSCLPKPRLGREDEDYVFSELDKKQLTWQDLTTLKTADDGVFAKPLLFRACVPPGMQRFRGNLWEIDSLPKVLQTMGYPLSSMDEDPSTTTSRNVELELGLQLCFLHPSLYKQDHPRFCNERFEYLGSKIQDVVMAEKLLMKHLDGPGVWLQEKHRRLLFNRVCGKYFREKKLHNYIMYSDSRIDLVEKSRRLRNFATTGVSQALHGLAYSVYGKAEVRRLMFQFFDYERLQAAQL